MKENIICTEDDKDFSLYNDKVNDRKVRFKIKDILKDHWNNFINEHKSLNIRYIVFKNVNKVLKCKTFSLGYTEYEYTNCHKSLIVPNTCKSRFCSSCGNKYNEDRSISIFSKLFNYPHRHVVWTIFKELRRYFRKDRSRLNLIFEAAPITVKCWFEEKYKKNLLTPAFISILHTYGRSLIWNPHIHMILLDGGVSKIGLVKVDLFSYASFRKRFMKVLLDLLEKDIGTKKFKEEANKWRMKIITNFNVDPLSCPICKTTMVYLKSEYF